MKYLLFKTLYKKLWKDAKKGDKKVHQKEILPKNVIKEESFFYSKYSRKNLYFNLYYNETKETRPLIIHIHGGGWAYGDKDLDDNFAYHLTKYGFNVASLSYTLAFKAKLLDQIHEMDDFIEYLYDKSQDLFLDADNIFMVGDSAGGQLIFLYNAVINNEDNSKIYNLYKKEYNSTIKAICLNHATPYIKDLGRIPNEELISKICLDGMKRMLLGKNFEKIKIFNKCEPQELLNSTSFMPPILILTSSGDKAFSYQSKLLEQDLKKLNLVHDFIDLKNDKAIHVFNVIYPDLVDSIYFNSKICEFFNKYKD